MISPRDALDSICSRHDLPREDARALFEQIMDGRVDPPMLAALLGALAAKGESVDELVGAALAMRARVTPVRLPDECHAIDTCGTGGDGKPTFNVSSAVAIVAAAAGATVAKHGNRSASRPSGSAECLAALGVNVEADVPALERCLASCRVAFLFAPALHPAMKHAAPVRKALGVRTIFNLLGPLTNPAGVTRQLIGVSRPQHVDLMIESLRRLGAVRAMVVCGEEGLCDLSIAGPTRVARLDAGNVTFETVDPAAAGLPLSPLNSIFVASPAASAALIERTLAGERGPARDALVFNTAAALWAAGLARDWMDGKRQAQHALESGQAVQTLASWRRESLAVS